MNDTTQIDRETIATLWENDLSKMHFQQTACFHIRNWSFGITGVVIPLIWVGTAFLTVRILLHLLTIAIIGLILHKDLSWHGQVNRYRDRARLCENGFLGDEALDTIPEKYIALVRQKNLEQLSAALDPRNLFLLRTGYVELYLIFILLASLVATALIG